MRLLKPLSHTFCALPLAWLVLAVVTHQASVNPVEYAIRFLGDWSLKLLIVTLAITPLRKLTGWAHLMTLRRRLGLWAFAYAALHLLCFWGADLIFSFSALGREIIKRPYIAIGMAAFVLLLPLALTSTNAMIKRLGGASWRRLHKLIYLIAPLGVVHFYWLQSSKNLTTEPLVYGAIVAFLLLYRVLDAKGVSLRLPKKSIKT